VQDLDHFTQSAIDEETIEYTKPKAKSASRARWVAHRSNPWFSWEQHRRSGFVLQIGCPKAKLQFSFLIHFHEEKKFRYNNTLSKQGS
jgi:hypothetical protein